MVMEDAAWARPEELKKAEGEAVKRALNGEFDPGNDYSAYYAYKTGANPDLIRSHAVADDTQASAYVRSVHFLLGMFGLGFKGNVIDLGCAIGVIPEQIRKISGTEAVTGIDISEIGIEVARRDYPQCQFLCQPADDLFNFPDEYANVIHGREFYPFTRTNDLEFQINCLKGFLPKLKPGGAIVLSMVCLSKGLCTNWPSARNRLLNEGYSVAERNMLIHNAIFKRLGAVCYRQPIYGFLAMVQRILGLVLGKKIMYIYVMIKQ